MMLPPVALNIHVNMKIVFLVLIVLFEFWCSFSLLLDEEDESFNDMGSYCLLLTS